MLLAGTAGAQAPYIPSEGNLQSRKDFSEHRLGIFLHWGIYSTYAQGEWYLSTGHLDPETYSEAAAGFYPARFDATEWAQAFKEAGAGYVTMTSRHHDGFTMFKTAQTPFNIVDATPFARDVAGELTKAVKEQGMRMHFYYSLIDWIRPDYPKGNSGVAKNPAKADYDAYFEFEKRQIRELLEQYHPQALWFDGQWDQGGRPFDWRMREL
ncbi:MAG: alpha-L-fucosidase, partial [Bacteroidales bacterium]|nr:alpha-L-fucosidase [Bacteroidales bacterium]